VLGVLVRADGFEFDGRLFKSLSCEDEEVKAGSTHHRFSRIPSPRRISSRESGSRAAAERFLAMLNFAG
jgi:hypothetical protein